MEPCLSVVIPAYNELATIDEVLLRVLAQPATREVIVVDDCSTDGTRERLAELRDPRIVVLFQPFNQGKGAALRRGFGAATSDFVVVQDADLEYDPADFAVLLGPLLDGQADVVFGSRFLSGGAHRVLYYWHSVGNRLLTTASNVATNLNLTDMETCYKVFRREVIQSIDLREDRFGFEPEVTAKIAAAGWRVYEVGVGYHGRTYAEGKKIGWRDGVRALYCIARYSGPGRALQARFAGMSGTELPQPVGGEPMSLSLSAPTQLTGSDGPAVADADPSVIDLRAPYVTKWVAELVQPWMGQRAVLLGADADLVEELAAARRGLPPMSVCGRDSASTAALRARFAGSDAVQVLDGPAQCLAAGPADSIVCVGFLEYEPAPEDVLVRLRAALASDGRIVLLLPGLKLPRRGSRHAGRPMRTFDRTDVRRLLSAAELRPEALRAVNASAARPGPRTRGPGMERSFVTAYDRAVAPVLRAVDERVVLPVGQSLFCVAGPATTPGTAEAGSGGGKVVVLP